MLPVIAAYIFIIKEEAKRPMKIENWMIVCLIVIAILVAVIGLLLIRLKKVYRENISGKFKDEEIFYRKSM